MARTIVGTALIVLLAGLWCEQGVIAQRALALPAGFAGATTNVTSVESLFDLLKIPNGAADSGAYQPPRTRGGLEVFQAVAPSVVVVRTRTGHGTGFIVDTNGTLVTNNHVVATGLTHDGARGASYATVHLGRLEADGSMKLLPDSVRAYLYKVDPTRDLAVLRIASTATPTPHLTLSDTAPRVGQECSIIGHPSSGMLWTMRPGEVASIGNMPADLVNVVMLRLASSTTDQQQLVEQLKLLPSRRIILTSAQANPGDSGGPVVDPQGHVIAVTFGGPGRAGESKFTYHVHLDELKAVLADVPRDPVFLVPDPWAPLGSRVQLQDLNGDGKPDVLIAGNESPETMLFDMANATPEAAWRSGVTAVVTGRKWRFQVGVKSADGELSAFYDTDNDGQVDLVVTGSASEGTSDGRFVRNSGGRWQYESRPKSPIVSAQYLKDPQLADRAERVIAAVLKKP